MKSKTPTLSAWLLCSHWTLISILQETLFLNQLHDFSLSSFNSFLQPFLISKIISFSKPHFYKPILSSLNLITPFYKQSWLSGQVADSVDRQRRQYLTPKAWELKYRTVPDFQIEYGYISRALLRVISNFITVVFHQPFNKIRSKIYEKIHTGDGQLFQYL